MRFAAWYVLYVEEWSRTCTAIRIRLLYRRPGLDTSGRAGAVTHAV